MRRTAGKPPGSMNAARSSVRMVSTRNHGKARALNVGLQLAATPFVLCMDGDSRLAPDTLLHGIQYFEHPEVAAVAGNVKVVNRNGLWTRLQALEYIEGLNMARRAQGFLRAVNIIPGPIGVFRRHALVDVGGYDTDTFAEDADLDVAVPGVAWSALLNAGQVCTSAERFYVMESLYDDYVAAFLAHTETLRVGDPTDPATANASTAPRVRAGSRPAARSPTCTATRPCSSAASGPSSSRRCIPPR